MKKYISLLLIFIILFTNTIKVSASSGLVFLPSYSSFIKGKDYVMFHRSESNNTKSRYILVTSPIRITYSYYSNPVSVLIDGQFVQKPNMTTQFVSYGNDKELKTYESVDGKDWVEYHATNSVFSSGNSYYNEKIDVVSSTIKIVNADDDSTYSEPNTSISDSIDVGYTNYNDVLNKDNSVYDSNIPYIKNFKVIRTKGPGAMAQHNLTWLSSEDLKQMRVEVALAYKVEASDSWFLNKKYNEGFAYYRTYADGLTSSREILSIPLSTSNPDGSFKDSVTTCIVGDLKAKFGDKEAMAIINATESNLKAYYIRNVVYKDGKYHYSQWVRCKVGTSYSVGNGGVVDEDGVKYEDKEDYPVDPDGNPEYDADGGRGESGFAILDFLNGVFDSITGIFTAFVDGVSIVMEGVGKLPSAFGKIFSALPEPVSVVFVMGMMICVFMRFLKR